MLNGKKGFIAVTLVMATILIGYFAPGWYTWTVSYTINPLTSFEDIVIPKTTGGTLGCACWTAPSHYELEGVGDAWYEYDDAAVGLYVGDGSVDWAGIDIAVDIALKDITELKFDELIKYYAPNGWAVQVYLGVDVDGDGIFEADIAGWHVVSPHDPVMLAGDSFVALEHSTGGNPAIGVWTIRNALAAPYMAWTPNVAGNGLSSNIYDVFAPDFLAKIGVGTYDTNIPNTDVRVKLIKLVIGGSGSWMDETAFVRGLTLNGNSLWYAEFLHIDKPLWVVFAVSGDDIEGLLDDYENIAFSIHIFKEDGTIYDVLILPLIKNDEPASEFLPSFDPANVADGYAFWCETLDMAMVIVHPPIGEYGVIKDVIYWTYPVYPNCVSGSFTVCIFGIEDEVFDTWEEHLP